MENKTIFYRNIERGNLLKRKLFPFFMFSLLKWRPLNSLLWARWDVYFSNFEARLSMFFLLSASIQYIRSIFSAEIFLLCLFCVYSSTCCLQILPQVLCDFRTPQPKEWGTPLLTSILESMKDLHGKQREEHFGFMSSWVEQLSLFFISHTVFVHFFGHITITKKSPLLVTAEVFTRSQTLGMTVGYY